MDEPDGSDEMDEDDPDEETSESRPPVDSVGAEEGWVTLLSEISGGSSCFAGDESFPETEPDSEEEE